MNFNSTKIIQILLIGLFGTVFNTQESFAKTKVYHPGLSNDLIRHKQQLLADTSNTNNLTVEIKEINFVGNTAFTNKQLTQAVTNFIGRKISFEELLEIEIILNKLYSDAGYINSGAVIPTGQVIKDGIITIQIIEGTIAKIEITGNKKLNSNYIRNRIALGIEKPFNLNQLLESLRLLQLDPLIENISVELSEGILREASILQVTVTEADSFQLRAIADNGRSPSVGSFRRGVNLTEANLLGFGDRISLEWLNTDGSNSLDFSYGVPINPHQGTIIFRAGYRDTEIIEEPFDRIDINGDSIYFDFGWRQALFQSSQQELALGASFSYQQSQSQLLGENFPLSPGANDDGETTISALRFFQEWTKRNPQEVLAVRSQFNIGLGILGATQNQELPDSNFFSWNGQGQYVRSLSRDTLLIFRTNLQIAADELVPLERFGLGGLYSVRGYRQDFFLTDNGIFISGEIQLPIARVEKIVGVLQIIPFIDFGVGWNNGAFEDPDPNSLLGIGLGLQWRMGDNFNARLDWGIPLIDFDLEKRTWQENGIYFVINYDLF